ncbi:MFS transporter [Isoptericola sp. BMS4]|uniref:MFS transporter n=1 Tax=Isoptericola sp. BMS4 TaxID=2527875 RepID=UPI0014249600|nr:MFS transporter [Isoptericola sp. BMS4]
MHPTPPPPRTAHDSTPHDDDPRGAASHARPPGRARVVAATAFAVITCAGVLTGMPNLLIDPWRATFGWSHATLSVAVAVATLLYGLTAPFAAALMDRAGMRRVAVAALGSVAIGAALTTVVTTPWQLVLAWGVLVGLGTGAIATAFGALVAERWFTTHRGLVTGFLGSATMFGGMVLLPLLATVLDRTGWRTATLTVAGGVVAVALVAGLLLRDRPAGARRTTPTDVVPRTAPGTVHRTLTVLRAAARPGPFWVVAGTFAVCGASTSGVMMTHFVPAAGDAGLPATTASALLAVMGVVNVLGTVAAGWLTDRVEPYRILAGTYLLRATSLAALPALLGPGVTPGLVVFTVSFGLLDLATVPPTIALCREHFGADGTIVFAWTSAAHQIGAGLAALAAGTVRAATGTYDPAWWGAAVLCVLAGLLCAARLRGRVAPDRVR